MRTTKHLMRRLVQDAVAPSGYFVSGNHIFTAEALMRIDRGQFPKSVSESPWNHSKRIVRAAELLQRTF